MATCGEMGQSRRNVCALSLVIFLHLSAHCCQSAPTNSSAAPPVSTNENPVGDASQNVTFNTDKKKDVDTVPSAPDQSPATVTGPKSLAANTGNDSIPTETEDPKDNHTTAIAPKTTNEQDGKDVTVIDSSDNTDNTPQASVGTDQTTEHKGNESSDIVEPTDEPALSETALTSIQKTPTTTVRAPKPAKPTNKQGEVASRTDAENQSTVESTDPELLLAHEVETTTKLDLDSDQYTDDDEDEDGTYIGSEYGDFEVNSNVKEQNTIVQKQPDGMEGVRLEPADGYDSEGENSHFFFHLVILAFLVAIVYITYHNKRKIFLLAQSRRWRDSLCSRNTVEYHRLDTNVNEAMPSLKMTRDYIF